MDKQNRKPTSSRAALLTMADSQERSARDNAAAWTMLGQSAKILQALDRADTLRRAADIKSVSARREFLRAAGIDA